MRPLIIVETSGVRQYSAGNVIDRCPMVVRVNSSFGVGYTDCVGTKTDALVLNPWFVHCPAKRAIVQNRPEYLDVKTIYQAPTSGTAQESGAEYFAGIEFEVIPASVVQQAKDATGLTEHFSFYLAALHLLNKYGEVSVYGIGDIEYPAVHYWDCYPYPDLNGIPACETIEAEYDHLRYLFGVSFLEDTL